MPPSEGPPGQGVGGYGWGSPLPSPSQEWLPIPCLASLVRPVTAFAAHFSRLYSYVGAIAHRVYKASSTDLDTLSFDEALKDSGNLSDWIAAANKEIQDLAKRGTWIEVDTSEAKTKILPGTWVFRRKRRPDGSIKKYKARYS